MKELLQQAQQEAQDIGIQLSSNDLKRIQQAYKQEIENKRENEVVDDNPFSERNVNKAIGQLVNLIDKVSSVVYRVFYGIVQSFGIMIIWGMSAFAEGLSVFDGFYALHPEDKQLAYILSWTLIFGVQFIEFNIHNKEHKSGQHKDSHYKPSLWFLFIELLYFFGIQSLVFFLYNKVREGRNHKFVKLETASKGSPATFERLLQYFGILVIVFFTFSGASTHILADFDGNFVEAYYGVLTQSNAQQFNLWVSSILRAVLFVFMAKLFTANMITKAIEVSDGERFQDGFETDEDVYDRIKAQMLMAKVADKQQKRNDKQQKASEESFTTTP